MTERSPAFRASYSRFSIDDVWAAQTYQSDTMSADVTPSGAGSNFVLSGLSITTAAPSTAAVYSVRLYPSMLFSAAQLNTIELLVDGVVTGLPLITNNQSGAAGSSFRTQAGYEWPVTGLSVGNHTFTWRTRNTAAGTGLTVRSAETIGFVQRVA